LHYSLNLKANIEGADNFPMTENNQPPEENQDSTPQTTPPPAPSWSTAGTPGEALSSETTTYQPRSEAGGPAGKTPNAPSRLGYVATFALGLTIPMLLVLGFIGGAVWQSGRDGGAATPSDNANVPTAQPQPQPNPSESENPQILEPLPVGGGDIPIPQGAAGYGAPYIVGNPDAPLVISVVEDLTCPFCGQFHKELEPVFAEAIANGEIYMKHYVVDFFGEAATNNANALACAAEQGRFSNYLDLIYVAQEKAATSQSQLTNKDYEKIAQEAGVSDSAAFATCVNDKTYEPYTKSVTAAAQAANIPGTPSYFIDGVFTDPSVITPEFMKQAIASS